MVRRACGAGGKVGGQGGLSPRGRHRHRAGGAKPDCATYAKLAEAGCVAPGPPRTRPCFQTRHDARGSAQNQFDAGTWVTRVAAPPCSWPSRRPPLPSPAQCLQDDHPDIPDLPDQAIRQWWVRSGRPDPPPRPRRLQCRPRGGPRTPCRRCERARAQTHSVAPKPTAPLVVAGQRQTSVGTTRPAANTSPSSSRSRRRRLPPAMPPPLQPSLPSGSPACPPAARAQPAPGPACCASPAPAMQRTCSPPRARGRAGHPARCW